MEFRAGYVPEAAQRCVERITDYLSSFLYISEAYFEPYISEAKTFFIPRYPAVWVVAQYYFPRFVHFAFRPFDAVVQQPIREPVEGEYVNEPLTRFKVPAYYLVRVEKAALANPAYAELLFEEIKKLVSISIEQINRDFHIYRAGATDSPELLRRAQASGDRAILFAAALNSNCPPDVVAHLSESQDPLILKAVACNPNLSPEQQLGLLDNPHLDHRGFCAIASRLTLDPKVRRRLQQCRIPSVQSYLTGPRIVEYLEQNSTSSYFPPMLAFFKHLLGQEYFRGVTRFNKHYFDYFNRHDKLDLADLISALQSQGIATKDGQKLLGQLFGSTIDKAAFVNVTTRLTNSIENAQRHRELDIKPFSFLIQYEHVWGLRWRRPDMNFNVALEYAPELYYPQQISITRMNRRLSRQFFHLWNNICWCSGRIAEHDGKMALFILELQCDFFRLNEPHVTKHFRDWSRLLLNIVIVEAKRRGIEAIYMLSSKALVALYGALYGMTYTPQEKAAWIRIYDKNADLLGMRTIQTTAVNIYPEEWNKFEWNEFYFAEIDGLVSRELVDSRDQSGKNSKELSMMASERA